MPIDRREVVRWTDALAGLARLTAIAAVVALVVGLVRIVALQGYTDTRLLLFGLLIVTACIGGVGVYRRRVAMTVAGAIGLFLLGFWQAVLFVFVLPVSGLLVLVAVLDADDTSG